MKVKMRVNVRRWEMHRDGEGIAVVPSCSLNTFLLGCICTRNTVGGEITCITFCRPSSAGSRLVFVSPGRLGSVKGNGAGQLS